MLHRSQGADLTAFAATALSRYLPPEIFTNSSRSREGTGISLVASTFALSFLDTAIFPNTSSHYLPDVDGGVQGIFDGVITTQSLDYSADDILWEKHINKDKSLVCAMQGTDAAAGWQASNTRKPPSGASKWLKFHVMAA